VELTERGGEVTMRSAAVAADWASSSASGRLRSSALVRLLAGWLLVAPGRDGGQQREHGAESTMRSAAVAADRA
jgi:hypothetical protein